MKKKGIIILSSVVILCALGLLLSPLMDWNVDSDQTSGNIGKSSRFSRKTTTETVSNVEELLLNDEAYKNGMVAAYVVMQTRAQQFDALVDMSNEVAGDISDFDSVLKDMNNVRPMIDNVCASLSEAGDDLNAALSGQSRPDLAQNTINASLAYTTLQKQNKLADRFIITADTYLNNNEGNDRLKFVRDQWVAYQQMTAALDNDEKAAAALAEKGYKLTPEQSAAALNEFGMAEAIKIMNGTVVAGYVDMDSPLAQAITTDMVQDAARAIVTTDMVSDHITFGDAIKNATGDVVASTITDEMVRNATGDVVSNITTDAVKNATGDVVSNITTDAVKNATGDVVSNITTDAVRNITQDVVSNGIVMRASVFSDKDMVSNAFNEIVVKNSIVNNVTTDMVRNASDDLRSSLVMNQIGDAIKSVAVGNFQGVGFLVKDL